MITTFRISTPRLTVPIRTAERLRQNLSRLLQTIPSAVSELRSLANEPDLRVLSESLLTLANRMENQNRLPLAAAIFALLEESPGVETIRGAARAQLAALAGRAEAPQWESLGRRVLRETFDPASLLAMGTAGAVFRMARLTVLSRLAASPAANFLTRGRGAGILAGTGAFAMEVPAFVAVRRGVSAAMGRNQDWTAEVLSHEVASSFLVLGALKLAGLGSHGLIRSLDSIRGVGARSAAYYWRMPLRSVTRLVLPQAGMFGGIMLGHRLEEATGLRESQSGPSLLAESLVTLLQFNLAGRMTRQLFGEGFHRWERDLELRQRAAQPLLQTSDALPWRTQAAGEAGFFNIEMMSSEGNGGGGELPPPTRVDRVQFIRLVRRLRPFRPYFERRGVSEALISRALSSAGSVEELATLILEAVLRPVNRREYQRDPLHIREFREIIRQSEPLRETMLELLRSENALKYPPADENLLHWLGLEDAQIRRRGSTQGTVIPLSRAAPLRTPPQETDLPAHFALNSRYEHWIEQLRGEYTHWVNRLSLGRIQFEFAYLENQLSRLPPYFVRLLSYYSIARATLAKCLILHLELTPSNSGLRNDSATRRILQFRADSSVPTEILEDISQRSFAKFVADFATHFPDRVPEINRFSQRDWDLKVRALPPIFLDTLVDPILNSRQYLFLVNRYGLTNLDYPEN